MIPAGPLREPVARGLARAHAAVLVGDDRTNVAARLGEGVALLRARLAPAPGGPELKGQAVVAFAGIGRPDKFSRPWTTAAPASWRARLRRSPSLQKYELTRMVAQADAAGARAVTTEKDAVRLSGAERERIDVLRVRLEWADIGALDALLDSAIEQSG